MGATPYWLAARFTEPNVMRLLVKHGADPKFVHHAAYVAEKGFGQVEQKETVNALMAAVGMIPSRYLTAIWISCLCVSLSVRGVTSARGAISR